MRQMLACLVGLLLCGSLSASNDGLAVESASQAAKVHLQADVQNYAQQLIYLVEQVSAHYVRPVPPADLLRAALTGLYEAARVPIPPGLLADLDRAAGGGEALALLPIVVRARESLGDLEAIRGTEGLLVSCRAMTRALDPYSGVVSGAEASRSSGLEAEQGVGLEFLENAGVGPLVIKAVSPGSPAQKAGLRPGDTLTHFGDQPATGMTSAQALILLNGVRSAEGVVQVHGESSGAVSVAFVRAGLKGPRRVALEREELHPETVLGVQRQADNSWDYWLDRQHKIAQVRIASLGNNTPEDLEHVLQALTTDGLRGLILDLRWCPGGFLEKSVDVARLLLGECNVATIRSRTQGENTYRSHGGGAKYLDFPVLVLVNGETSGGGELIAAALQDNGRAIVAGQRTLGKASIQSAASGLPIPGTTAGIKLTSGTFVRPSGKNLHRFSESQSADFWGVVPDAQLEFRVSPELGRQLREWWLLQTLRPGRAGEMLPLDDPLNDPQRQAALQALLGKMDAKKG